MKRRGRWPGNEAKCELGLCDWEVLYREQYPLYTASYAYTSHTVLESATETKREPAAEGSQGFPKM